MFQFSVTLIKNCGKIPQFKLQKPGFGLDATFLPSIQFNLISNIGLNNNIPKI